MSGLEMAGLMGGEIRDPERTLPRAGWIASGFTTLFYAGVDNRAAGDSAPGEDQRTERPRGGRRRKPRALSASAGFRR